LLEIRERRFVPIFLPITLFTIWSQRKNKNQENSFREKSHYLLFIVYIGEHYAITPAITPATATHIVLALATLGVATKIETILSVLLCPRWPGQVSKDCRCRQCYRANFCQWKHSFTDGKIHR